VSHVVTASGARLPTLHAPAEVHDKPVVYGIRPEHLDIVEGGDEGFEATVIVVEPSGSETLVLSRIGKQEVIAVFRERHAFEPGAKVRFLPRARNAHLFDASSGQRI